ncbi:hypothetical protein QAD02_017511 [Eretmocerus hayati]|uniref:Uncharacterized protein n=1 Tax=Eretmocerus hayati TaxID=131215 RepID=A0ACC2PEI2_9HYME|nr:hypothetical protein QAD02_017511 [Eretmocerus hayati]
MLLQLALGLSLGGGLIVLASALSEASWNLPQSSYFSKSSEDLNLPQYRYGWCLQLSGLALILSELAALLTISGYMARFPTVEDMVRVMVPGAERKLREQRGLSSEYLVRTHQKSPGPNPCTGVNQATKVQVNTARVAEEGTSLLCKTAPDICASNPQSAISYVDKADLSHVLPAYPETKIIDAARFADGKLIVDASGVVDSRLSGFVDKEGLLVDSLLDAPYGYDTRYNSLAGHTVPITLKHQHAPASPQYVYQNFGTIHSGVLRVAEPGQGMMNPGAGGQVAHRGSMTLQNPKRKVSGNTAHIAQNTFSTLECERRGSKRGSGPGGGGGGGGSLVRSDGNGPLQPGLKNNFCAGSAV